MAVCMTPKWVKTAPQARMSARISADMDTSVLIEWDLSYVATPAIDDATSRKQWRIYVDNRLVDSGIYDIRGKRGLNKITSGNAVVAKSSSKQVIKFRVEFDFDLTIDDVHAGTMIGSSVIVVNTGLSDGTTTDWQKSMQQTFEYYTVDPGTWKDMKKLDNVKSATITRDSQVETLGSATINVTDSVGECYIRIYLITIQNGVREKHPLGTFLVQTPTSSYNGKIRDVSMDAYTPLLELKESPPPLGYSILRGANIMENAYHIVREKARAPVIAANNSETLYTDFVANTDDTWISFLIDLIANAKYTFALDELGRILFTPKQETASLQPVWTYTDDNSSILYPDITMDHDLYGIPNVIEVIYSDGKSNYYARVVNDDPNSPISTVNRGREIVHRVNNPDISGNPTNNQIKKYAQQLLEEMSTMEYTITYIHGYCPVRIGDCVRLDCSKAGLTDIKAKVISQTIKCEPGCPVTEKAVFTTKLWG